MTSNGATSETRTAIERARALAPGRDDYALLHAHVLAELGEFALARNVLGPLMTPSFPENVRATARSGMNNVVRMEQWRRANEASKAAAAGTPGRAVDSRAETRADATRVRPLFRDLQGGEQRLEGTLERIACPDKAGVTFQVRTATGDETLQASKFEAVDFTTYRDDLSGSITCGQLQEPLQVYVTWRQGAEATTRIVVAIEFLPK